VQTVFHFQRSALSYETYASGDDKFLQAIWEHNDVDSLRAWLKDYTFAKEEHEVPDFNGYLYVEFVFTKNGLKDVEVTNVRYVTMRNGATVLTNAFENPFRVQLLMKLAEAIETHEADKIESFITTLSKGA